MTVASTSWVPGSIGVDGAAPTFVVVSASGVGPPFSLTSVIRRSVRPGGAGDRLSLRLGVRDRDAQGGPVERALVGAHEVGP